jgi:hypothetical protein
MGMNIVMAIGPRDRDLALRVLAWSAELGRQSVPLYLVPSEVLTPEDLRLAVQLGNLGFESVEVRTVWELPPHSGWPVGPNAAFITAANWMSNQTADSWFFWEPDAIPLRARWAELLSVEYSLRGGGGILGIVMPACPHGTYRPHVSGVAIYPRRCWAEAGRLLTNLQQPFDLALAPWSVPIAHGTRLIQQMWLDGGRSVEFKRRSDMLVVSNEAVVFHRDKAGVLITLLRQSLQDSAAVIETASESKACGNGNLHQPRQTPRPRRKLKTG